jgi:hypothetical protein
MKIEYHQMINGKTEIAKWIAMDPLTIPYLYVASNYSVWMVPGYEEFWS